MIDRRQMLLRLAGVIAASCLPMGCRLEKKHALREESSLNNLAMAGPPDYSLDAWNDFFQGLVVARGYDPPYASRFYAYLTLAQACAVTNMSAQIASESTSEPTKRMAAIRGTAATAALEVLRSFFPAALASRQRYQESISSYVKQAGLDHSRAVDIGTNTSQLVQKRLMADGADDLRQFRIPEGASVWRTEENRPPVRPYWDTLHPALSTFLFLSKSRHPALSQPNSKKRCTR